MSLPDNIRFDRLRAFRKFIEVDETLERSIEMKKAYEEIRYSGFIKRLRNTAWHTLDADSNPNEIVHKALKIIRGIMKNESEI